MFKIKNKRVIKLVEIAFWNFMWFMIAFAWSGFFDTILVELKNKILFLGIFWYLFYAIFVSILAFFIIKIYVSFIDETNENETNENETNENLSNNNK